MYSYSTNVHPHANIVVHELTNLIRRLTALAKLARNTTPMFSDINETDTKAFAVIENKPSVAQRSLAIGVTLSDQIDNPQVMVSHHYNNFDDHTQLLKYSPLPLVMQTIKESLLENHSWRFWGKHRALPVSYRVLTSEIERTAEALADICWFSFERAYLSLEPETGPADFNLIQILLRAEQENYVRFVGNIQVNGLTRLFR